MHKKALKYISSRRKKSMLS